MNIVNCTPHVINYYEDGAREPVVYPYTGLVPRVSVVKEQVYPTPKVWRCGTGAVAGLPEHETDTLYIVSRMVADTARRHDLIIPVDFIRDSGGQIKGCRAFEVRV